jgi:hypothetical protein
VYLHLTALGAIMVSGFWAMVNERFDPRTARQLIGRITVGASVGGLLGGVLPERVGTALPLLSMLPILALLHLVAVALTLGMERGSAPQMLPSTDSMEQMLSAPRILRNSSYLVGIALLVALTSSAEGVLDYVFKMRATTETSSGESLLRFFAAFYTATALIGILIQVTALRWLLNHLGVARTAAVLPAAVAAGSAGAFFVPGLLSILLARGVEVVVRSSISRGAYELLFTPVAEHDKRATKLLLDVGAARIGDVIGGLLILIALTLPQFHLTRFLLALSVLLSFVALWVARRLHFGYVKALEGSLERRAGQLSDQLDDDPAALLQTIGGFDLSGIRTRMAVSAGSPFAIEMPRKESDAALTVETPLDKAVQNDDPVAVRSALTSGAVRLDQAESIIELLAWDAVAADAIGALGALAPQVAPVLLRHLLDPEEDFAIRRRLVGVLASYRTPEVFEGLFQALGDRRFEVRYRAGLALSRMADEMSEVTIDRERVLAVISREMSVERTVWESRQLIDAVPDAASPLQMELLHDRVSRSMEHLFSLLSLILPRATLRLTFQALHTEDSHLHGTALEYLATVLPEPVWRKLWGLLETGDVPTREHRPPVEALRELLKSQETVSVALAEIRRAAADRSTSK